MSEPCEDCSFDASSSLDGVAGEADGFLTPPNRPGCPKAGETAGDGVADGEANGEEVDPAAGDAKLEKPPDTFVSLVGLPKEKAGLSDEVLGVPKVGF